MLTDLRDELSRSGIAHCTLLPRCEGPGDWGRYLRVMRGEETSREADGERKTGGPSRDAVAAVKLRDRQINYVQTMVPDEHFTEEAAEAYEQWDVPQIRYGFSASPRDGHRITLQYYLLRDGLSAYQFPLDPVLPASLAIIQGRCAWVTRTSVPIETIEPVEYGNGEGVLYFFEAELKKSSTRHGVFVFSSDAVSLPGRVEIQLRFSEDVLAPEQWKPLILRIVRKTRIVEDPTAPGTRQEALARWFRRKAR